MFSKVVITASGDSEYLVDELVDRLALHTLNEQLMAEGREPARAKPLWLDVTLEWVTQDPQEVPC